MGSRKLGDNLTEIGELELQVMLQVWADAPTTSELMRGRLDRMMFDKKQLDQLSKRIEEAPQRQK